MAESVTNSTEETKANTPLTNQSQENREELIEDIVQLLNRLFEPTNLSHNAYLTQRATGVSFQIPVKFIYEEYKIKTKSYDREIIDQALERAENVVVNKKGDVIESVRPKHDQLRKNITVRGITREHEAEFKKFVNSIEGVQEGVVSWNANPQLNIITIVCRDEESAHNIFNHLSGTQFKEAPIECSLDFENLYILALENLKNKKKTFPGYQQNMMYMMPPFQMQMPFFNQMNSGYMNNFFPPQNFYMPNPAMNPLNNFINPNPNGSAWQGNPQHKNTGFKRGGPRKYRGDRGRYYKNDRKSSRQETGVVVNEGDFPPLSNENQENE